MSAEKVNLKKKVRQHLRIDESAKLYMDTKHEIVISSKKLENSFPFEYAFRYLKDTLATRPIYHHKSENTKGHVFCSYLALVLVIELRRRLREKFLPGMMSSVISVLSR